MRRLRIKHETTEVCPIFPKDATEVNLSGQVNIKTIADIPETVKRLNLEGCKKLKALPELPWGIEEINLFGCLDLETIANIPSTVKKLNLGFCKKLKVLPELFEGLEEINLSGHDNLELITQIPGTVKKLNIECCSMLKFLPNFAEGIEEIFLFGCHNLETIPKIPGTVKKLHLTDCDKLNLTPELITSLAELEEQGCEVRYPSHFNPDILSAQAKEKLNQIIANYCKENPNHPPAFSNITTILHRFLTEGIDQRSKESNQKKRVQEIAQSTLPTLEILEKNPHLLPAVDESVQGFLGCVNQPVRAWSEVSALMAIAAKGNILDRLKATKQLLTLDYIADFIGRLPKEQKVGRMVEVEAGNALYREVHKKLVGSKTLEEPWLGVPGPISHGDSIEPFLTEERIQEVTKKVESQIISMTKEKLAERICESQHSQAWGEICFPEEVKEIKEFYAKQRKEFVEKDADKFTEQDLKKLSEIDSKQSRDLTKKIKEETVAHLPVTKKPTHAEKLRNRVRQVSDGFGKDVFDPRNENILTRTSATLYAPTKGGLRPSEIQHGDVKNTPKTTIKNLFKESLKSSVNSRGS